jgi:hypothetical protein
VHIQSVIGNCLDSEILGKLSDSADMDGAGETADLVEPLIYIVWKLRIDDEHAGGWLPHGEYLAAQALLRLIRQGVTTPTVARIAKEAAVSDSTVRRMIRRLCWQRNLLKTEPTWTFEDGAWRQRANRYILLEPPEGPVLLKPQTPGVPKGCHGGAPRGTDENHLDFPPVPLWKSAFRNKPPAPLVVRQRQIQEQLAAEYAKRPKIRPIRAP